MTETLQTSRHIPIIDPTPARRKRLIDIFNKFLEDKASIAELKGISKEKIYQLADAGWIKFKHGRIDEAEQIYKALLLLDHRNAYFHSVMAAVHQKKKRPVEAILEYSRAIQINTKDISSFVNRGEIYLRHKNFKKAAEDFKNAIMLDMSGRNLWANRARSLVIALKRLVDATHLSKPA
ncbi:MAG: hypothetical protein HYY43_06680 [Deltaproteobacteria bacterium]|nr:hypothetical protein [Deltaproteobacteria bacterium]MBI2975255.1 hypothetical protein [Deltaproteobacteria bacterium]